MPTQEEIQKRLSALRGRMDPNNPAQTRLPDEPLKIHRVKHIEVTVADLKAAIAANPKHSIAEAYTKGIMGMSDDKIITVEQPDIVALMDNKGVRLKRIGEQEEEGVLFPIYEKELIDLPRASSSSSPTTQAGRSVSNAPAPGSQPNSEVNPSDSQKPADVTETPGLPLPPKKSR